ncbi:hypothetical protein LZ31DRAFT_117527 [Colletotrichum somersetense]|nr:hypothetical protein LZ31DRAFT_117527 [Colletotrichum somersetense]
MYRHDVHTCRTSPQSGWHLWTRPSRLFLPGVVAATSSPAHNVCVCVCVSACLRIMVKKVPRRRRRICSAVRQHLRVIVIEAFPDGETISPSPQGEDGDSSLRCTMADRGDGPGPKSSMLAQLQLRGGDVRLTITAHHSAHQKRRSDTHTHTHTHTTNRRLL